MIEHLDLQSGKINLNVRIISHSEAHTYPISTEFIKGYGFCRGIAFDRFTFFRNNELPPLIHCYAAMCTVISFCVSVYGRCRKLVVVMCICVYLQHVKQEQSVFPAHMTNSPESCSTCDP